MGGRDVTSSRGRQADPAGSIPATLAGLQAALAELAGLPPVERARRAPALIDAAKRTLSVERGRALAEARADGWTETALAGELGVHRSKVADAIALYRRTRSPAPPGRRSGRPVSRSRAARQLAERLTTETGTTVEVTWDAVFDGWAWHVQWSDGPTAEQMRKVVDRVAPDYPAFEASTLGYLRDLRTQTLALALIVNVRAGRPALDGHRTHEALHDTLRLTVAYPERAGDEQDQTLAHRLTRWPEHDWVTLLDTHGLAALTGELATDSTVVPITSRTDR